MGMLTRTGTELGTYRLLLRRIVEPYVRYRYDLDETFDFNDSILLTTWYEFQDWLEEQESTWSESADTPEAIVLRAMHCLAIMAQNEFTKEDIRL